MSYRTILAGALLAALSLGAAARADQSAAPPSAPASTAAAAADWNQAARAAVLDGAETAIGDYTYAAKIPALRASIAGNRATYLAIDDPAKFAKAVSDGLYAVAHDKHLRLNYSPLVAPPENHGRPSPQALAHFAAMQAFDNYGYAAALRLRGNVGYLRLSGFASMPGAKGAIDAAMASLAHTDALVIDVRHNHGGDPDSLDYLMGYFYAKPVQLTSIVVTQGAKSETYKQFSAAHVDGPRYLGKPLYVLTDDVTFSCAEQFAYDMKSLRRATLIGKTTGGGANPGGFVRLSDHFSIFIPLGRAENPYTGTNWEGVGVVPDVAIAPAAALLEAYTRALNASGNSFDVAVQERAQALKDPAAALAASLPQT